jgi:galactitol-specific phosphotransferase system IIB component
MNLKKYLESDIIDFEINQEAMKEYSKLFSKDNGIRSYMTSYASYTILYNDKKVILTNVFEENYKEIKAFKIICNKYGFTHEVQLLNFTGASKRDNIIQTIKFHTTMEHIAKTSKSMDDYDSLINTKEIIEESERRFENFLTLKDHNDFSIIRV